jgi:hypothetical protein
MRSLLGVREQLALAQIVTDWYGASHPHPFSFGSSDLVANAFSGDLALELRE